MSEQTDGPVPGSVPVPPWYWRLCYRLFDRRLPPEYGPWLVADLTRPGWPLRLTLAKSLNWIFLVGSALLVVRVTVGKWWLPLLLMGGFVLLLVPLEFLNALKRPVTARKELLDRHGFDKTGALLPDGPAKGLSALSARWQRLMLPRRELAAMLYGSFVVASLGVTTVVATYVREHPRGGNTIQRVGPRDCVKVPDAAFAAVQQTLLDPGAVLQNAEGVRYEGGLAVAGWVFSADNKTASGLAIWFVTAEGRGYRVTLSPAPKTTVRTSAPEADFATDSAPGRAGLKAITCIGAKLSRP